MGRGYTSYECKCGGTISEEWDCEGNSIKCDNCKSPYPKDKDEAILKCHKCEEDFTWDGGNDNRGNIFECEDCGKLICFSCLSENGINVSTVDKIQCLDCLDK